MLCVRFFIQFQQKLNFCIKLRIHEKKLRFISFAFALGISFTSCTKDFEDGLNYNNGNQEAGNGNGNNPAGTGVFKATVGGNAFVANSSSAIVTDNFVLIAGIRTSNKDVIQITLPSNKVGTYTWANSEDDGEKFVLSYGLATDENPFISASNEVAEFLE